MSRAMNSRQVLLKAVVSKQSLILVNIRKMFSKIIMYLLLCSKEIGVHCGSVSEVSGILPTGPFGILESVF